MNKKKISQSNETSLKTNSTSGKGSLYEKDVSAFKAELDKMREKNDKKLFRYPTEVKAAILEIHYKYGVTLNKLSMDLDISNGIVGGWKKALGNQKTAVLYGKTTRNDIRTISLAVHRHLDLNMSPEHLAEEFHVSKQTISSWIAKYKDKYKEYLDLPDGVMIIAPEDKHIYGDENIKQVRELLLNQQDELRDMIQSMQKNGIMANAIAQAKKRCEEVSDDIETLKKADEIMSKNQGKK